MKTKTHFHFKQFSVAHAQSTMKVGTDAVLLGAWVNVEGARHVLDIGTGNGTIALMMAQRTDENTFIDAVEIDAAEASQAHENFLHAPSQSKMKIYPVALQEFFPPLQYDLIVSNPPYFINSQSPPDKKRYYARHTVRLDYPELLSSTVRLLQAEGKFNVILPFTEGLHFITLAKQFNLFCTRQVGFKTREGKPIERWLLEFAKHHHPLVTGEIILYKSGEEWSEEYKQLTKDFYLRL